MTALIGSYTDFEKRIIVAAYYVSNRLDRDSVSVAEIRKHFSFEIPERFARIALSDLSDRELANDTLTHGKLDDQTITLTAAGIREAETIISRDEVDVREFDIFETGVPASDRLVSLDHNSIEYQKIAKDLSDLRDEFHSTNNAGESGEERDRILDSLDSAITLWSSTQLKIIQIKVGVLMVVEDAGLALQKAGKSIAWSLIQDLIKSYVKNKTGIDF